MSIGVKELLDQFNKAMIIDFDKKSIWVLKDKNLKVYPKKYFDEFMVKFNFKEEDL